MQDRNFCIAADDCKFSSGMTQSLTVDNYESEITNIYQKLLDELGEEEKLVITYGGPVTKAGHIGGDSILKAFDSVGHKVPVYGGLASDGFNFSEYRVFYNDKKEKNAQVMVLVSGNISPRVVCINSVENRANLSYEVTESQNNQVFRLGNGTFVEAMEKADFVTNKTDVLADYILSPFLLTIRYPNGDSVEVARNLSLLNPETGSGSFLGAVPEGSVIEIGIINRDDVQRSVQQAFDEIIAYLNASDVPYHTLLCSSCAARFLALASNTTAEAETYIHRLPEGVSLLGLYAYGEFCPVVGNKTREDYNMFHNFTFTILAI